MYQYFEYGNQEIEYLKSKDSRMAEAMDKLGMIQRRVISDPFVGLVYAITGQQISGRAAQTVWNRLCEMVGEITPENIGKWDLHAIQSCGMSMRKAQYIKGIAEAALSGAVDFQSLHQLSDSKIIQALTAIRGVGVWTAEMLLIFSLCRPDVVSFSDFGIRKGMMKLYDLKELDKEQFKKLRKRYSPYGTVASFYLWEMAKE